MYNMKQRMTTITNMFLWMTPQARVMEYVKGKWQHFVHTN